MSLKLYNSLSRKIETFKPLKPPKVGIYTCGPTVYDYVSVGNWRTYVLGDLLVRSLKFLNYQVDYVMNITDVGHLTGDNIGDADAGEDRIEKGARREKRNAWEIAEFYTQDFFDGFKALNLTKPKKFVKATDHIKEQIELVKAIENRGFAYKISDGIYFDVRAYEKSGFKYGELSSLDQIKEGARVRVNPEKKDSRDFALWKFSPKGKKRQMEWESPWGKGFPGWHIECSAMSMKYLGEQFDVHIGGEDLKHTHHPNEIAQSESATGKRPLVRYWIHGAFLLVDGRRMGRSLGNAYNLHDLEKKGFDPLALRYFYLNAHYRTQQNFTWEALKGAQKSWEKLQNLLFQWQEKRKCVQNRPTIVGEFGTDEKRFLDKFRRAIADDLNLPEALAVVWEMTKGKISEEKKEALLLEFDRVLGLNLRVKIPPSPPAGGFGRAGKEPAFSAGWRIRAGRQRAKIEIKDLKNKKIKELVLERERLRKSKKWLKADQLRKEIEKMGYKIEDTSQGPVLGKK